MPLPRPHEPLREQWHAEEAAKRLQDYPVGVSRRTGRKVRMTVHRDTLNGVTRWYVLAHTDHGRLMFSRMPEKRRKEVSTR